MRDHTPVRARRGRWTHGWPEYSPDRTSCGLNCNGWAVADREVDCPRCLGRMGDKGP